ncbi:tetratricopeptide repeat-containing sensor histidine kinase [Lacihabitans soyangensis]|uniref:Sensor histidine kinase n=1 Tax=Lacihabitans soyangensis TaxID=869394 RepID=A0AAE3H812_9BACT|nr:tetratricopeptide repeat protein [Lacihabitans soyangensis]MCP9764820.1 sensor histidine kinase [Lacihabitans soyangensis]
MKKNILIIFFFVLSFGAFGQENLAEVISSLKDKPNLDLTEMDKAFAAFKRDSAAMRQLSEVSGFELGRIFGLNSLGVLARNTSNYKESIRLHQMALKAAEELKHAESIVSSLNMLGVSYRRLDEVRLALDYHKQALSISDKIKHKSESILRSTAVSLNSIGNIYLVLKQYELAEQQFTKSMEIEKKLENKLGLAINYQNIGIIKEAQNKLDAALQNYKTSLEYNLQIKSELGKIICENSIGQILIKQNKPEEGLRRILPTIALAEKLGDKYYITMAKVNSGWALSILKDYPNAEKYLQSGLEMAIANSFNSSTSEAYTHLAYLYESKGEYPKALENLKKKQEFSEKILNEENLRYTAELIVKYDNEKKESQIALLEKENELVKYRLFENQRIMIFAGVLLALLAGLLFIWYRQYQLKSEKKVLMLEQQMMRSQMNPHFLFNSLNSIKLYIINNEKENAVYYLNKFSKLIRAILSNSREKEISLKEELEMMELYVNIESIRFTEKIHYDVIIDESIDTERIKIPSMILQPFIENAIWHGLSNKVGDKNLKIYITNRVKGQISFEIVDNGIGRQKAQEIKENKVSKQNSIGLKLTKERLENFAKNINKEIVMDFEDMVDNNQQPLGTKAIIILPIK